MISVLILTRNEELDLRACLESVAWCDDVYVFDSMSTDRTQAIATSDLARSRGVHFVQRKFDGYSASATLRSKGCPFAMNGSSSSTPTSGRRLS